MSLGVSGRALAALLGVSDTAVRKAVKAKRIQPLSDGSFDADACRAAWSKTTDPARNKVCEPANLGCEPANNEVRTSSVRTEADAQAAVALITRVLRAEGVAVTAGDIGFAEARTADTILKAYERDLKIAQRRKELVPLEKQKGHVEKSFLAVKQAIQRIPSRYAAAMAAELGCDPVALDALLTKAIAADLDALSAPVVRA